MTSFTPGAPRQRHNKQSSTHGDGSQPFADPPATSSTSSSSSWSSHDPNYQSYPQHQAGVDQGNPASFDSDTVQDLLFKVLGWILTYTMDLLLGALKLLKPVLSFCLVLWLLSALASPLTGSLSTLQSELQTRVLCKMPLMGYIINCGHLRSPFIPNFADLVDKQARTYEYMLNSLNNHVTTAKSTSHGDAKSANEGGYSSSPHGGNRGDVGLPSAGVPLPIQLKKAEIAIVDLKVLVAHSGLPDRTKTLLVDRLERFHKRAKVAGRKLQTLQVRADSCIDNLVIRNTFVTRELDRLSDEQQRLERLNAERSFLRTWLSGPVEDTTIEASNRQLQTVYQGLMGDARDVVRNMILQAQDVLLDLNELESLLVSIHSISHHEQQNQNRGRDEILAILWTHLGANQVEMKSFNENLQLLQGVCDNREQATGRVQATLMKLNEFEDELGILREKMVDAILDPLLSGRSGGSGSDRISSEDESATDDGTPGQEPPLSHEMVARVLRSHVEQIDRTTARLRQRSFSAGSIDDHMAWKKAP